MISTFLFVALTYGSLQSGISSIDDIFKEMAEPTWSTRHHASGILNKLRQTVYAMSPGSLLIDPEEPARL